MKSRLLFLFLNLSSLLLCQTFENGQKLEAQGDISGAISNYTYYFKQNINTLDSNKLKKEIIHVASLYNDIDLSINFLKNLSTLLEDRNKRNIVYNYIANMYELTGEILEAGKYYEKASIRGDGSRDITLFLNSLELLQEVGFLKRVNRALIDLKPLIKTLDHKEYYNLLLGRNLLLLGNRDESREILKKVNTVNFYNIPNINLLKTPNSYIGVTNYSGDIGHNSAPPKLYTLFIGRYSKQPSGTINILEQLKLDWEYRNSELSVVTTKPLVDKEKLDKAGINYDIR